MTRDIQPQKHEKSHDICGHMSWDITCVGVAGFEPTTSSSRTKRATKLRHTPCLLDSTSITSGGQTPKLKGMRLPHIQKVMHAPPASFR